MCVERISRCRATMRTISTSSSARRNGGGSAARRKRGRRVCVRQQRQSCHLLYQPRRAESRQAAAGRCRSRSAEFSRWRVGRMSRAGGSAFDYARQSVSGRRAKKKQAGEPPCVPPGAGSQMERLRSRRAESSAACGTIVARAGKRAGAAETAPALTASARRAPDSLHKSIDVIELDRVRFVKLVISTGCRPPRIRRAAMTISTRRRA